MLSRKMEILLLLFRCLFYLHGIFCAFAISVESSTKVSGVGNLSEPIAINNKERRGVHDEKKFAIMSIARTHNKFTRFRASLIKGLSRNKSMHAGFQKKKLKQELRKRQVSLFVS